MAMTRSRGPELILETSDESGKMAKIFKILFLLPKIETGIRLAKDYASNSKDLKKKKKTKLTKLNFLFIFLN